MTDPQIGLSMLFLFIFIIMLGFPIAFTLIAMGVGFGYYAYYVPGQEFFNNRIFTLLVFPAMLRAGYDVKLSAGVVCAGGCLGILIPPSILLIVYAATAGVSAVKLYAAAFFPGFMLAAFYVVYVIVRAMINPALAPKLPPEQTNVPISKVVWALATSFLPLALLIVAVLGAILFGLATPSEAAGAGALASMILAAAYGALNYTMLRDSVYLTARATAMVCYLFIGSWTFSSVFAYLGGQSVVEQFFLGLNLST